MVCHHVHYDRIFWPKLRVETFPPDRAQSYKIITALAKRTPRKSTQACKTRTCASRLASVHASRKKVLNFTHMQLNCDQRWNGEKLAYEFELDQSQRKWVDKRNASQKLASTYRDGEYKGSFVWTYSGLRLVGRWSETSICFCFWAC